MLAAYGLLLKRWDGGMAGVAFWIMTAVALSGVVGRYLYAQIPRSLNAAVSALRGGGSWTPLIGLAFAYGVFHAAGPGHGKAVIAGYILAGERALRRGAALSVLAALLQACVAGAEEFSARSF